MRKLPVGIQSFEDIRTNEYVYVDKTAYIYEMVSTGKTYFLSRPRRFGKSLMVSALQAYFMGRKELFRGLAIETYENEREGAWASYPVFKLDFAGGMFMEAGGLADAIDNSMRNCAREYGICIQDIEAGTLASRFGNLLQALFRKTGRKVAVLIDEYDKPLLDNMSAAPELETKNRELLRGYFGELKKQDDFIKFIFITGVTKFNKVTLFSDLNNLEDISLDDKYSGICGITDKELVENFSSEIQSMSEHMHLTADECLNVLKNEYDGYRFSTDGVGIYNPFSLLNALKKKETGRYWFESGTPGYLIREMQKTDYTLEDFSTGIQEDAETMKNYREGDSDLIPLFYQSGYLTIEKYDPAGELYTLGFPNEEVAYGFEKSLVPYVLKGESSKRFVLISQMAADLEEGNADLFMQRLRALMASIPYPEGNVPYSEREWRNQVYLVFKLLGQRTSAEVHTSMGRVDCVVENASYVYIFEFKQDKPVEDAIFQIEDRNYSLAYEAQGRKVIKIGSTFLMDRRTFMEWEIS